MEACWNSKGKLGVTKIKNFNVKYGGKVKFPEGEQLKKSFVREVWTFLFYTPST